MLTSTVLRNNIALVSVLIELHTVKKLESLRNNLQDVISCLMQAYSYNASQLVNFIVGGNYRTDDDVVRCVARMWVTNVTTRTKVFNEKAAEQCDDWFRLTYPTEHTRVKSSMHHIEYQNLLYREVCDAAEFIRGDNRVIYIANETLVAETKERLKGNLYFASAKAKMAVAMGYKPEEISVNSKLRSDMAFLYFMIELGFYEPKSVEEVAITPVEAKNAVDDTSIVSVEHQVLKYALFRYLRESLDGKLTIQDFVEITENEVELGKINSAYIIASMEKLNYRDITGLVRMCRNLISFVENDLVNLDKLGKAAFMDGIHRYISSIEGGGVVYPHAQERLDIYQKHFPKAFDQAVSAYKDRKAAMESELSKLDDEAKGDNGVHRIIWRHLEQFLVMDGLSQAFFTVSDEQLCVIFDGMAASDVVEVNKCLGRIDSDVLLYFLNNHPSVEAVRRNFGNPAMSVTDALNIIKNSFLLALVYHHYRSAIFKHKVSPAAVLNQAYLPLGSNNPMNLTALRTLISRFSSIRMELEMVAQAADIEVGIATCVPNGKNRFPFAGDYYHKITSGKYPCHPPRSASKTVADVVGVPVVQHHCSEQENGKMAIKDEEHVFHTILRHLLNTCKSGERNNRGLQQSWLVGGLATAFHGLVEGTTLISTTHNAYPTGPVESPNSLYTKMMEEVSKSMVEGGSREVYWTMAIDSMEWLMKFDVEAHFKNTNGGYVCVEAMRRLVLVLYFFNTFVLGEHRYVGPLNPFDRELENGRCVTYMLSLDK